jgi:hypothetical protein
MRGGLLNTRKLYYSIIYVLTYHLHAMLTQAYTKLTQAWYKIGALLSAVTFGHVVISPSSSDGDHNKDFTDYEGSMYGGTENDHELSYSSVAAMTTTSSRIPMDKTSGDDGYLLLQRAIGTAAC